jgi:hypothetical protein
MRRMGEWMYKSMFYWPCVDPIAGLDKIAIKEVKIIDPTGTQIPTPRFSSPQAIVIPTMLPWHGTLKKSELDLRIYKCHSFQFLIQQTITVMHAVHIYIWFYLILTLECNNFLNFILFYSNNKNNKSISVTTYQVHGVHCTFFTTQILTHPPHSSTPFQTPPP